MASLNFGDIITFTRASSAGRFNSSGLYEQVASNIPRLDFDPVTMQARGLLIEEQRTNLLTYSEQFDNAVWTKNGTTVTANATASPDGTANADKLVEDTSTGTHSTGRAFNPSATTAYSLTFFVKSAGRGYAFLVAGGGGMAAAVACSINLSSGAASVATGSPTAVSSVDMGGGWHRVSLVFTTVTTASVTLDIRSSIDGVWANRNYTGDGTSGIYIWGAQLEAGAFPTSYIPTTTAQVTRAADIASVNTLSPWYNSSEGTLFVEFATRNQLVTFADAAVLDDGTANNRVRLGINTVSPNKLVTGSYSSGVSVAVNTDIPYTLGLQKLAASYAKDNFASAANGALYAVVSAGDVPAGLNTLHVGKHTSFGYINGHIRVIKYLPKRVSNSELQAMTQV